MSEPQDLDYTDIKSIRRNAMEAIALCQKLIINYEETESYENVETANQIIKSNFRILAATADAYEYSKLDTYAPRIFNLCRFLEDTVSSCQSVMRQTSISFSYDCEQNLCVNADPERLLACLLALITNSIQHMDSDVGEIKLKATRLTDTVSISVIDNGFGIDSSVLEDFLDYSKSKGGLAVVKKFCEVVGSSLITDTSPDCGFMASFRIPLAGNCGLELKSDQPIAPISTFSPYNIYLSKVSEAIVQFEI